MTMFKGRKRIFAEEPKNPGIITKSSAIVYSITETAKANNLNPFRYLEYVLTVMKDHQEDTDYRFIEDLLPW